MESAPRFQVLQLTRILLHFFEKLLRVAINVDRAIEIFAACRCGVALELQLNCTVFTLAISCFHHVRQQKSHLKSQRKLQV
jgi:hypothetical protein